MFGKNYLILKEAYLAPLDSLSLYLALTNTHEIQGNTKLANPDGIVILLATL